MSEFDQVEQVLGLYFDGLHYSDTEILRRVFDPQAHYYCATDGTLLHLGMDEYFPLVDKRPSPASQGHARTDRILSIEFAGPVTAFARLECSIPPKHFTDLLTLVKLENRWQILAKAFHYELKT
ncbi:MAG: nuclear transport factor 2 family protein [Ramlibacter sp.]|nr:nuclear transport factor 2 family protein [Ramlibacter sp.]